MKIDRNVLSATISISRFPLIWLVVLLHTIISPQTCNGVIYLEPGDYPIFDWFQYFSQRQIGDIAVPTFMMISGYLFFRNGELSVDLYLQKIKKRIHSLLIPYIVWNLLFLCFVFACYLAVPDIMSSMKSFCENLNVNSFIMSFVSPILAPMWFIRDLLVLDILAFPIYFFLRKYGMILIVCLLILFLFQVGYKIPFIGLRSLFPFCLGAYLSISHQTIIGHLIRFRWTFFLLYFSLLVFDAYSFMVNSLISFFHQIVILMGIFAFLTIMYSLVGTGRSRHRKRLEELSFFVFAFHMFFINILNKFWPLLSPVNTISSILAQVTIPTVACGFCILTFEILNWISPFMATLLIGGRTDKKK